MQGGAGATNLGAMLVIHQYVLRLEIGVYDWMLARVQEPHAGNNVSHVVEQDGTLKGHRLIVHHAVQTAQLHVLLQERSQWLKGSFHISTAIPSPSWALS